MYSGGDDAEAAGVDGIATEQESIEQNFVEPPSFLRCGKENSQQLSLIRQPNQ